ncbi:MAG: DUF2911 domain-containing protein [Candidatus Aminicenantes bacterium]|nr:DUF2911 domain-containing protein [Candidatus Aminicenantes bacterium]
MRFRSWILLIGGVVVLGCLVLAQAQKPACPPGTAATQVGGKYVQAQNNQRYQGGKWIEISYGRPIKRERQNVFGAGAEYGKKLNDDAPVWRAGANQTTRLKTEVPLVFDGKTLPAGEYCVFVDLKEKAWTIIFSTWPAQEKYDPKNKEALWGSYGYTPDKDVLRATMKLDTLPFSMDQFTIAFIDITSVDGKLAMMWDKTMATVAFKVGS